MESWVSLGGKEDRTNIRNLGRARDRTGNLVVGRQRSYQLCQACPSRSAYTFTLNNTSILSTPIWYYSAHAFLWQHGGFWKFIELWSCALRELLTWNCTSPSMTWSRNLHCINFSWFLINFPKACDRNFVFSRCTSRGNSQEYLAGCF